MSEWKRLGHETTLFMHTHEITDIKSLLPAEMFFYKISKGMTGTITTELNRSRALSALIKEVKLYRPDIICLRWSMYAFPLQKLFNFAPVVIEINTHDVFEHHLLGNLLHAYNLITRSITLGKASGFVFTTKELANANAFKKYKKQFTVISNGIDIRNFEQLPAPNNPIPHLVFIGTPDLPWQGVEKLVALAEKQSDIFIDVIGCDELPLNCPLSKNLHLHGYQTGEAFCKILSRADTAIGTLSLYRKGMQEAAPLKVREYAAYGIPLILPYKDTDLHNLDMDSILEIPNSEDNIDKYGKQIHDFAYAMRGKRLDRATIFPLLDIQPKEQARINFFNSLLRR